MTIIEQNTESTIIQISNLELMLLRQALDEFNDGLNRITDAEQNVLDSLHAAIRSVDRSA